MSKITTEYSSYDDDSIDSMVHYCNQYDSDVCHVYKGRDFTPPHECMFWHTCYFDAYVMCDNLRYVLEELENVGE